MRGEADDSVAGSSNSMEAAAIEAATALEGVAVKMDAEPTRDGATTVAQESYKSNSGARRQR